MGFKRVAGGLALSGLLAGCQFPREHTPPRLMIRATETPRKALGFEEPAAKAAAIDAVEADPPQADAATGVVRRAGGSLADIFLTSYDRSYAYPREATFARRMARHGMTLIDTRCDLFFQQIGRGAQTGDFARRELQSLTATLVGVLGLLSVGKDAVTSVGLGSALGIQSLDNYSTVYFFSPEVASVQQLVRRAFSVLRAELLSPTQSPADFDEAIQALRTYQNICTAHEIKRLVTEAIDKGQAVAQFGDGDTSKYAAAADRALSNMAKALGVQTLSLREAVLLKLSQPGTLTDLSEEKRAEQVDYVCSTLSLELRTKLCSEQSVNGGAVALFRFKDQQPDADAMDGLRAGWATLQALIGPAYAAEQSTQLKVLSERVAERQKALSDVAAANRRLNAAKDEVEKRSAQKEAREAEQRAATASSVSKLVSDQVAPSAPATGVGIEGGVVRP